MLKFKHQNRFQKRRRFFNANKVIKKFCNLKQICIFVEGKTIKNNLL